MKIRQKDLTEAECPCRSDSSFSSWMAGEDLPEKRAANPISIFGSRVRETFVGILHDIERRKPTF